MLEKRRKILKLLAVILILVAFFQIFWPYVYNSPLIANLNPYPTKEYLQIVWLFSPKGLSTLTIILGCIFLVWVAITGP